MIGSEWGNLKSVGNYLFNVFGISLLITSEINVATILLLFRFFISKMKKSWFPSLKVCGDVF